MAMKNGSGRFAFYLQHVDGLLVKAGAQKDPALWLFRNGARTPFFMLESLARIYGSMHNPKKFEKLKEHFKLIEDSLGQIDYYNWLSIASAEKKRIPAGCKRSIKNQLDRSVANLNEVLVNKGWLSDDKKRIKKIAKKLSEADWLGPEEEVKALLAFYEKSIASIDRFVDATGCSFDNVEEDVHELRRKLRWLSIYPQALQGVIQYADDAKPVPHLKKYLTKEIVSSPFNKLPLAGNNTFLLLIDKNYFLALSWMIDRLGVLKDEGLLMTGLCETIKQSTACKEEEAMAKAYSMLGSKQRTIQVILNDAEAISKVFFREANLQHLIAGTAKALN